MRSLWPPKTEDNKELSVSVLADVKSKHYEVKCEKSPSQHCLSHSFDVVEDANDSILFAEPMKMKIHVLLLLMDIHVSAVHGLRVVSWICCKLNRLLTMKFLWLVLAASTRDSIQSFSMYRANSRPVFGACCLPLFTLRYRLVHFLQSLIYVLLSHLAFLGISWPINLLRHVLIFVIFHLT